MTIVCQDYKIQQEFVDRTQERLSNIQPFCGVTAKGFKTNFLGVKTSHRFFRLSNPKQFEKSNTAREISTRCPTVESGESYFEVGSLLEALSHCNDSFCMAELGGGWGARTVDANALVRQLGIAKGFYIVVEAMRHHFQWIYEHMQANGIDPVDHSIIQAAVWKDNKPKLFPDCAGVLGQNVAYGVPELVSNLSPSESRRVLQNVIATGELGIAEDFQGSRAKTKRSWTFVSSITLRDIFLPLDHVDFVDMDIQGAELEIVQHGIEILDRKVKRMHIGTHSHHIHTTLTELFSARGWEIVIQIPPAGKYSTPWGNFTTGDGILSVVNHKLTNA